MRNNDLMDKFQDECGIFGIFSDEKLDLSSLTYIALNALQHRGQESCGLATFDGNKMNCYKGMGLVSNVFNNERFRNVTGSSVIGHVRYSTCGGSNITNAQPIISESTKMAIAHNGNIVNAKYLRLELEKQGTKFRTSTDSEVILKLLENKKSESLEEAILKVMRQLNGGYSVLLYTEEKLIGFRDPKGIRPLCIGKIEDSYVLASESCALDSIGAELIRDLYPGEIVTITAKKVKSNFYSEKLEPSICAFEYIYFARQDSIIDKISVYKARISTGINLWRECPCEADIVIGVPSSGVLSAMGYARAANIPYDIGFQKNEYIGRTFIEPSSKMRTANVKLKLNVIKESVKGKRVVVVDDSIVRGTTSGRIVQLLRSAGAKEIHFRSASPIIKYPCFKGINTPDSKELIGSSHSVDAIRDFIGADSLQYISISGLLEAIGKKRNVCLDCFIESIESSD